MASMPITLSVVNWTAEQVATWLKGINESVASYSSAFLEHGVTGRNLLFLTPDDLDQLGIVKIGHQDLILEIAEMLAKLTLDSDSETLQKVALRVSSRSKSLLSQLRASKGSLRDIAVLAAATYLLEALNELTYWLGRPPFASMQDFTDLHKRCVKDGISISSAFSRRTKDSKQLLETSLNELLGRCEDLIQNSTESLIIQPSYFETVTIRKRADEELGLHINSSHAGVHEVKRIKKESAAELNGKVEEGDEIVQVNYQTVVGWTLKSVVHSLRERPKEAVLTVKHRPRHANTSVGIGGAIGSADRNRRKQQHRSSHTMEAVAAQPGGGLNLGTYPKSQRKQHLSATTTTDDDIKGVHSVSDVFSPSTPLSADPFSDEVFCPSSASSDRLQEGTGDSKRTSFSSGGAFGGSVRPTILVTTDAWDKASAFTSSERSTSLSGAVTGTALVGVDSRGVSSLTVPSFGAPDRKVEVVTPTGKQEFLSSFHVVRSVPELRRLSSSGSPGPVGVTSEKPDADSKQTLGSAEHGNVLVGASPVRSVIVLSADESGEGEDVLSDLLLDEQDDTMSRAVVHDGGLHLSVGIITKRDKKGRQTMTHGGKRLVSVVDLGRGDLEGWLYMKGSKSERWAKTYKWCVLKQQDLYCYNDKMSTQATCHIYLPMFKVSEAPECKGKKHSFKVHNSGTIFFFAANSSDEMLHWMNELGLAAIAYNAGLAGQQAKKHDDEGECEGGYSESSDTESIDMNDSERRCSTVTLRRKTKLQTALSKNDDLRHMVKSIREANLDITGIDITSRHLSRLSVTSAVTSAGAAGAFDIKALQVKQRQLKALEEEWRDIGELQQNVTSEKLKAFLLKYDQLPSPSATAEGMAELSSSEDSLSSVSASLSLNSLQELGGSGECIRSAAGARRRDSAFTHL